MLTWECSTKLDAEKRLALQQEKEALDMKLLEVYVRSSPVYGHSPEAHVLSLTVPGRR